MMTVTACDIYPHYIVMAGLVNCNCSWRDSGRFVGLGDKLFREGDLWQMRNNYDKSSDDVESKFNELQSIAILSDCDFEWVAW